MQGMREKEVSRVSICTWLGRQIKGQVTELGQKQMEGLVRINDEFHFSQVELEVFVEEETQQEPKICYKI